MQNLIVVIPPAQPGYTNERDQSGGIGVSRKLKPGEEWIPNQPPLDLLIFAAVAEQAEIHTELVDLMLERLQDQAAVQFLAQYVDACDGEVWIGVRLSIPSLLLDLSFANAVKARYPHAHVFAMGGVIMATFRHWIHECHLDFLVYGEPEAVMSDVFHAADWKQAPGIIVVDEYQPDGKDPFDPATSADYIKWKRVSQLASLPRPAWHLAKLHRYTSSGDAADAVGVVQGSRGCPIACTMCAYTMLEGAPLRVSDGARVVDEIAYLQQTYGIKRFMFQDANFSYDRRLLKSILSEMQKRDITIDAAAELSLEMLDRPTLELMYQAGIRTILTGVETNDEDCMKSIGQNIKVNPLIKQKIGWCDDLGIKVYTFFLVGAPEESWHSLRRTVAFAKELRSESTLTLMTPFPGTPLYWRAIKEGLLEKEMVYEKWGSYTATVRTYHLTLPELQRARLWARLEIIIPFRLSQARKRGARQFASTAVRHVPHMTMRQVLRAYVSWKADWGPTIQRRRSSRTVDSIPS